MTQFLDAIGMIVAAVSGLGLGTLVGRERVRAVEGLLQVCSGCTSDLQRAQRDTTQANASMRDALQVSLESAELLQTLLREARSDLAVEARRVNELAIELAQRKSSQDKPGGLLWQLPTPATKSTEPSLSFSGWWKICSHCGWEHMSDTAVVDGCVEANGRYSPLTCRCLRCQRHWTESDSDVSPVQGALT